MEDLARLHVAFRVLDVGLVLRQRLEGLDGELRPDRERLERGEQRVPPEQRREPRDAGGDVPLIRARAVVDEQAQVTGGSEDREVEQLVVGADLREPLLPRPIGAGDRVLIDLRRLREQHGVRIGPAGPALRDRRAAVRRLRRVALGRPREPAQLARLARAQLPVPREPHPARVGGARDVGVDRHGLVARLAEQQVRPAPHVVEAVVAEGHAVRPHGDREMAAARGPDPAADLEDVGGIGGQLQVELDLDALLGVVDDLDPLLEHRAVEQPVPPDAQLLRGERVLGTDLVLEVAVDPRVGQLDRPVEVAAGRRLEQDRPLAVDPEDRARQPARIALVQAEAAGVGVDVAERVGQQVQVALLEDLDGAEVGRLDDRADDGLDEAGRLRA